LADDIVSVNIDNLFSKILQELDVKIPVSQI